MPGRSAVGVKSIKMGACGTNGLMGTTLVALGLFVPDSVIFTLAEPSTEKIMVEDISTPYKILTDGEIVSSIEWQTRDISPATLAKFISGTTVGEVFTPDTSITLIEQSVEFLSLPSGGKQFKFEFPRVLIKASIQGNAKKKDTFIMKVVGEVLNPFDASNNPLAPYKITRV